MIATGLVPRAASLRLCRRKWTIICHKNLAPLHNSTIPITNRLASRIPTETWDTHMHVIDPRVFPLDKSAHYQPSPHTVDQAIESLGRLGIQNMVIVQPSVYGNDNACTLDALRKLGLKHGRAVIQFDPSVTSTAQLREWHDQGVRGVRLNFKSVGLTPSATELDTTMRAYAAAVREFDWVLELYIAMQDMPLLESVARGLKDTKICIDHVGHPTPEPLRVAKSAADVPGFSSLLRLLDRGNVWVKLSATYRLDLNESHAIVESLCRQILRARPDRCVFATDWPHTRFDKIEIGAYIEKVLDWCEEEGVSLEQVLVKNAEELFDA